LGSVRVGMDCFEMGGRVESWIPWVLNDKWLAIAAWLPRWHGSVGELTGLDYCVCVACVALKTSKGRT
jgi:hypothetical protein